MLSPGLFERIETTRSATPSASLARSLATNAWTLPSSLRTALAALKVTEPVSVSSDEGKSLPNTSFDQSTSEVEERKLYLSLTLSKGIEGRPWLNVD